MSIIKVAAQSAVLKSAANIVAQLAARWQDTETRPLDWQRVIEFAIFGLIQSQLNYVWQAFLEDKLPTRPSPLSPKTHTDASKQSNDKKKQDCTTITSREDGVSWSNVLLKLLLDQTIGLFIMNSTFLACTNAIRLRSPTLVVQAVQEKILGVIIAAWKLWPWVSIVNFLWVPVEKRVLVASCVGFGWNIFLALSVMTS